MKASKLAIVHEWVEKHGGAELVLDELVSMFSEADLFVLWSDYLGRYNTKTYESFLATTPLRNHKALSIPFQLAAWRSFNTNRDSYEKIIVSSHLFAHHVFFRSNPDALKYVYTHTPARYVWEPDRDKRGDNPLAKIASSVLKPIDKMRAQEAYKVAANSEFTKQKIQLAWNREAQVIYPPVRVSEIQRKIELGLNLSKSDALILSELPSEFILGASRFVPYKNLERVIQIGEWLKIPVVIAGSGPLVDQLETRAKNSSVTVSIVQRPSDDLLFALYKKSVAYIFPPVEDFGIMPVEASAAGARVLANYKGGASESVLDGVNGALVDMESKSDIISGFDRLRSLDFTNASTFINKFDKSEFRRNIEKWVSS